MELILVKGAGELASGIAHRFKVSGYRVVMTELEKPLCIRRAVSFAQAVFDEETVVEGIKARFLGEFTAEAYPLLSRLVQSEDTIPVSLGCEGIEDMLKATCVIDARMAKRNIGNLREAGRILIGIGPGLRSPVEFDAVVETNRGHNLGRVIYEGEAEKDTGIPAPVEGVTWQRLLKAPCAGSFIAEKGIGERVVEGEVIGKIILRDGRPEEVVEMRASISGVVRGILHSPLEIPEGTKVADIDPRGEVNFCYTISDKARGVAGGAMEALLTLRQRNRQSLSDRGYPQRESKVSGQD